MLPWASSTWCNTLLASTLFRNLDGADLVRARAALHVALPSHQTGWTGLVAKLVQLYGFIDPLRQPGAD